MCAEFVDGYIKGSVYIVASPFKTGTTSVGVALKRIGAGKRVMPFNGALLQENREKIQGLNRLAETTKGAWDFKRLHGEEVRNTLADLTKECARYDIFADAPMGHTHIHPFIRHIIAPDAKFIWVNRNFKEWRLSVERWQIANPETYKNHAMWKTRPENQLKVLRNKWRQERRNFRRLARWIPDDCIELQLEQQANTALLAAFCGLETSPQDFPVVLPGNRQIVSRVFERVFNVFSRFKRTGNSK